MHSFQRSIVTVYVLTVFLICLSTHIKASRVENSKLIDQGLEDGIISESNIAGMVHPKTDSSNLLSNRRNDLPVYTYNLNPRVYKVSRSKFRNSEVGLLAENDGGEISKRFDDYGHMRFGKRGGDEQFDDYGHMRFGRNV